MRELLPAATVVCCSVLISGCADLTKAHMGQGAGMVTGGVVGGVIGQQIGGRGGMIAGAILGSVIGGMIGYEIGQSLDEQDRALLRRDMALALNGGSDNQLYSWTSPKSKSSAQFSPGTSRWEERKLLIRRSANLDPTPAMTIIGEPYVAKRKVALRSGPRKDGAEVAAINKGEQLFAIGRVQNSSWLGLSRDRQNVIGYVEEQYMVAKADAAASGMERNLIADTPASDGVVRSTAVAGYVEEVVPTSTSCRLINYKVTKDGTEAENGQVDACKGADGNWVSQKR